MTQVPAQAPDGLHLHGFTLDRIGLLADGEPTFDQWLQAGKLLRHAEGAVHWWIGDWLNYGEGRWGEMYAQALDATEFDYDTLAHDKRVSASFIFCRRRQNLSWSHHEAVAGLDECDQDELLSRADAEGWSRAILRQRVRELKQSRGAADPTPFDLIDEAEAIFSWLCRRRERWPEHLRTAFADFVRRQLHRMESGDDAEGRLGDGLPGAGDGGTDAA